MQVKHRMSRYRDRMRAPVLALVIGGALATAGVVVPATVVAAPTGSNSNQPHLTRVTVGNLALADNVPVWMGVEKGFFKAQGLDVSFENISGGGPAIVKAVQSKSVDFGQLSSTIFLLASAQGVQVKGVAAVSKFPTKTSPEGIFVKATSPIKTIQQLKGRTIGVDALTSLEATRLYTEVLPAAGLSKADVRLVPMPFPQMQQALESGLVDAVIPFDPYTTRIRQLKWARQLTDMTRFIPTNGLPLGLIIARTEYVAQHPVIVKEFRAGLAESIKYVQDHSKNAAELTTKIMKVSLPIASASLEDLEFVSGGTPNIAAYGNMLKALREVQLIHGEYDVSEHFVK